MFRERISLRENLAAIPFILPFLVVFALFIGYPLFYSLFLSFHKATIFSDFYNVFGTMQYVGFGNYRKILTEPVFLFSILLTLVYALLIIGPGIALSLTLALMLNRKSRSAAFMRSGFFLPNVFDIYVVGVIWLMIYNPRGGIVSPILGFFGFESLASNGVLNNAWLTLPAIALVMVLKNAGFGMILFLTSLNNISESIFEAADVDGASGWQKLVHITIPMLRPTILFLSITGLVGALNAFAEIYALTDDTGGTSLEIGDTTLRSANVSGYHLFKVFNESMYGEAAAISFVLLAIAIVIAWINFRVLNPRD